MAEGNLNVIRRWLGVVLGLVSLAVLVYGQTQIPPVENWFLAPENPVAALSTRISPRMNESRMYCDQSRAAGRAISCFRICRNMPWSVPATDSAVYPGFRRANT